MNEDEISPLPTKGVTFKDFNTHLPDIKEATLEGSQFEAPAYTGSLSPPGPPGSEPKNSSSDKTPDSEPKKLSSEKTPEFGNTTTQRPKTTVRRTISEKSLQDEEITKSPNISRKPTQDSLRPGTVTPRKSSPGSITPRKSSPRYIAAKKTPEVHELGNASDRRSFSQLSVRKIPSSETPDNRVFSQLSRKETNGDIHSQNVSRNGTHGEILPHSQQKLRRSTAKHPTGYDTCVPGSSHDIVQRKGKVVTDAW